MDNFILKSFRDKVQKQIETSKRLKNIIIISIVFILIIGFTYIVTKQISFVKYFFS